MIRLLALLAVVFGPFAVVADLSTTCTAGSTSITSLSVSGTSGLDNNQITTDGAGNIHLLSTNQPVNFAKAGSIVSEGGATFQGNVLIGGIVGIAGDLYMEGNIQGNTSVSAAQFQMQAGHGGGAAVMIMTFADFTIPVNSILAMTGTAATDFTLMTAPGNQYFRVLSAHAYLNYGGAAYSTGSAFGLFWVSQDLSTRAQATSAGSFPNGWITGTSSRIAFGTGVTGFFVPTSKLWGSHLTFGPSGATTVTTGNSQVTIRVFYLLTQY